MKRADAIDLLTQNAHAVRDMGATALYRFGSTARNEAQSSSDLDIFIDYDPSSRFSLVQLVEIKQFLEAMLALEVDLTTRNRLHALLRDEIEQSAIRVF
ncbi:nucleotidyltransferase family protein [Rhizobium halophytocola]|uniref:Nucleotidyltransferase n=1 Tax=Rhizobium halophytocola TaxID=735519 RepID=A0ABS4DWL2_9HYPH|nr:nucleotidyltransferase domain-containing protein [Rhizobium halophytocola]MBP1850063.1 putative nucleotidyltransferase [Rhizobium halophytocola]